jgi:hypothetical protein
MMVQPAHLRDCDNPPQAWRLDRSGLRALQRQMRPAPMVFGIIPECRSASLRNVRSASPESPLQFLKCGQHVRHRPAPSIESPGEHHVDLAATCRIEHSFAQLTLRCAGANLLHLQGYGPAPPGGVLPQGGICNGVVC